uniref:Uncharacterized protein n=1 Tax=Ascaris lumbricoides TaxID=6252 RepID=A0A0M3IVE7_ASCLU
MFSSDNKTFRSQFALASPSVNDCPFERNFSPISPLYVVHFSHRIMKFVND